MKYINSILLCLTLCATLQAVDTEQAPSCSEKKEEVALLPFPSLRQLALQLIVQKVCSGDATWLRSALTHAPEFKQEVHALLEEEFNKKIPPYSVLRRFELFTPGQYKVQTYNPVDITACNNRAVQLRCFYFSGCAERSCSLMFNPYTQQLLARTPTPESAAELFTFHHDENNNFNSLELTNNRIAVAHPSDIDTDLPAIDLGEPKYATGTCMVIYQKESPDTLKPITILRDGVIDAALLPDGNVAYISNSGILNHEVAILRTQTFADLVAFYKRCITNPYDTTEFKNTKKTGKCLKRKHCD